MEKPKITPWDEENINKMEPFIVFKPVRIDLEDGKGARPFNKGDKVSVRGTVKKDLYFQNKIMYAKDFDAVVGFEKKNKLSFSGTPEVLKESAALSQKSAKEK